jgi:hypothetical protein
MRRASIWNANRTRVAFLVAAVPLALASVGGHTGVLPSAPGARAQPTPEQARIEHQPVCIGSSVESAGVLSDVLYYRAVASGPKQVTVGYFAFFSEERPWGNNWLTWSVLPALAIDLVYSRSLLVAPGLQRVLYGAGDVEGVAIEYDVVDDGTLRLRVARADDGSHRPVNLSREDALAIDPARPTFYTDVWSHQLGAKGVRSKSDLAYVRCYDAGSIHPLPDAVARAFRVDDERAPPAHVEKGGGARIDVDGDRMAGQAVSARAPASD